MNLFHSLLTLLLALLPKFGVADSLAQTPLVQGAGQVGAQNRAPAAGQVRTASLGNGGRLAVRGLSQIPLGFVQEADGCANYNANLAPGILNYLAPVAGDTIVGVATFDPTINTLATPSGYTLQFGITSGHVGIDVFMKTATGFEGTPLLFYPGYSGTSSGPGCGWLAEISGTHVLDQYATVVNATTGLQQALPPKITPSAGALVLTFSLTGTRTGGVSTCFTSGEDWIPIQAAAYNANQHMLMGSVGRQPGQGVQIQPPFNMLCGAEALHGVVSTSFSIL